MRRKTTHEERTVASGRFRAAWHMGWAWVLGLLVVTMEPSCHRKQALDCPLFRARIIEKQPKRVLALVDGHPVGLAEVRSVMREKSLEPRAALDEAIDCKLLELEALRRGLDHDPDVVEAAKAAAARKLVKKEFEPAFKKSDVPVSALKKSYQLNIHRFQHPELRKFSHVLVRLPWRRKRRKRIIYREEIEGARKLAEEFRQLALAESRKKKLTWKDFEALADRIRDRGFKILAERGLKAHEDLRKSFADELFEMKKPGDISQVVKTVYGFHVIFLVEIVPPKHISFEEAKPEILDHVYPELRRDAFNRWVDALKRRCPVTTHPELIPIAGTCASGSLE